MAETLDVTAADSASSASQSASQGAAPDRGSAADRTLRYRLRKARERRRRRLPLEEDLTALYIADAPEERVARE
jgi:hypothetical protein